MLKSALTRIRNHGVQRGESGQAIIILAIGFIALIAFVGIVTDISLMFVRYSTLSRAVDAAAIAAAGQMRSDRSFGEVGLAARQFIDFHGLDPEDVLVETCQTTPFDVGDEDQDGDKTERHPTLCPPDQRKLVRVSATIISPTVFMRLLGIPDIEITAVALSETAVLDVVIIMDVSESMLFETTYEDWGKINMGKVYVPPRMGGRQGDPNAASENNTIYQREYQAGKYQTEPLRQFWDDMLILNLQQDINNRLFYANGNGNTGTSNPNYAVEALSLPGALGMNDARPDCRVRFWPYSTRINIRQEVKTAYASAGLPSSHPFLATNARWDGFAPAFDFYGCCNDPTINGQVAVGDDYNISSLDGVSPIIYDQAQSGSGFGGDFRFNDLICQPFKQARDATLQFLDRIDFERGDRVAFVTVGRGSFVLDPDGARGEIWDSDGDDEGDTCASETGIDHDNNPATPKRTNLTHMIESKCRAEKTLLKDLGVRAEPYFYVWNENGGGWQAFADGLKPGGGSRQVDYTYTASEIIANPPGLDDPVVANNTYPVRDNCPFHNATLRDYRSKYSLWNRDDPATFAPLPGNPGYGAPAPYNNAGTPLPGLYRTMLPTPWTGRWAGSGLTENNSYELWSSCSGTNFGAALRGGNNALLDPSTTRRTGTVWVMVLLSDGAAGASDPVRQAGRRLSIGQIDATSEKGAYADWGPGVDGDPVTPGIQNTNPNWEDWGGRSDIIRYGTISTNTNTLGIPLRTEYGAFGLCPPGTPEQRARLTEASTTVSPAFPFCSDTNPRTRNFCGKVDNGYTAVNKEVGGVCPDTPGSNELVTGPYPPGFQPGSRDRQYNCNPDSTLNPLGEDALTYNLRNGSIYDVDIGTWDGASAVDAGDCSIYYDVDDYARDWADYVGLSTGTGDEQLPNIFTIGFGLNFPNGATGDPGQDNYLPGNALNNIPDHLGEELLRYIADVGDNFEIDTDHQQDWRDDGIDNDSPSDLTYGVRGPCETAGGAPGEYAPLPPTVSCGNYYNAPNQAELQLVFNDIASRMFTRLTG